MKSYAATTPRGALWRLIERCTITKYLKDSKISSIENFEILNVTPELDVSFHFFGESSEAERIRSSLHKLVMQQRRLGDLSFEPSHFQFHRKPALRLQSLKMNHGRARQMHQGDQLILTCTAIGSSDLRFSWYKDDKLVNISKALREMSQMRLPSDGSDLHTSMLTIAKVTLLDNGVYTCQAIDIGVQQCSHIRVNVRNSPTVRIVPMSSTVEKGSSLRLICTTPGMRGVGIGFGWRKNRALLRLATGSEIWEDLYPAGSLLSIANATRSAVYTCYVAQSWASVQVEVIERVSTPSSNDVFDSQGFLCPRERNSGFDWPETKAGSKSLLECPRGFVGEHASRQCSMRGPKGPEWLTPDFSKCLYEPLRQPYHEFQELTLGYEGTNASSTVQAFWEVLQYRKSTLYPGEGDRIIGLLLEIEHYQRKIDDIDDLKNSAEAVMRIIDKILGSDYSIMNQQNLVLLTQMTARSLEYWSQDRDEDQKHLSLPQMVADVLPMKVFHSPIVMYSLRIPRDNHKEYPDWYNERVTIRLYHDEPTHPNKNISGIVVVYRNLAQFFPDTYFTELEDGSDLEYRLSSQVVSVSTGHRVGSYSSSSSSEHVSSRFSIELELGGGSGSMKNESGAWNASCGILGSDGSWRLDGCSLSNAKAEQSGGANLANNIVPLHCLCSSTGTFAAFVTARAETVLLVKHPQINYAVILGCSICLFCSLVSLFVLFAFWWRNRTWLNFLNVQCCIAVAAAMTTCIHAVNDEVPEDEMPIVAICLEAFFLVGMSSPISQALIIYAELSHIHPSQQFNPTVVAVITGVPILAMLMTELTRKTIGWKQKSWWLVFDTRVFYIFVICSITLLLTFFLLYIAVIHRTKPLLYKVTKKGVIQSRIRVLHRSAFILFGITAVEVSSILYVNRPSVVCHYVFAILSTLLGVIIFAACTMQGDSLSILPIFDKLTHQTKAEDDSISGQTKVPSKGTITIEQDRELSTSSGGVTQLPLSLLVTAAISPAAYEPRGVAAGVEEHDYVTEAAARAYQRVLPGGICTTASAMTPHILIHHVDEMSQLQLQQQQLRQSQMSTNVSDTVQHLHSRQSSLHEQTCAKLKSCLMVQKSSTIPENIMSHQRIPVGITKSTMTTAEPLTVHQNQDIISHNGNILMPDVTLAPNATTTGTSTGSPSNDSRIIQVPINSNTLVQNQSTMSNTDGLVVSTKCCVKQPGPPVPIRMPDLTIERKQPDGEAEMLMTKLQSQIGTGSRLHDIAEEPEVGVASNPTNGCVLDQISHDLDYLLNRTRADA
ncbi:hypothetical protein QAD02_018643 [Eretmocerus hayati]|uniref:Uncharacterized protein n=1 Tax=Eretmocerus hayati TaxID=131215 RepID=A0ACC2PHD1_9HYME|nr:hypothetical protein QAD02_018643 [Eretmocerus hayati]